MPNTPSSAMRGAIGAYANAFAGQDQKALIEALIRPLGYFTWVDEEDMIDAVTAISGSGPAYVFLFMEALRDAGKSLGLSDDIARNLALQTISGAAALAEQDDNIPFEELRYNVTSPGGTTECGLAELLDDDALKRLVQKAADSAYARAKDIAG